MDIKKLQNRALKFAQARIRMIPDFLEPQDFAQEYILQKYLNPKKKMDFVFVDWLRGFYGRKNSKKYEVRKYLQRQLRPEIFVIQENNLDDIYFQKEKLQMINHFLKRGFLTKNEKKVLKLRMDGRLHIEIGNFLDVTESRSAQLEKSAIKKIKQKLSMELKD